ncbi:mutator type transposase [Tanacetum coccineum]
MVVNDVKKVRVVGLSYGGFVAYSMAVLFKEMVERVVICCAGVCLEMKDLDDGLFPVKTLEEAAEILLPQTPQKMKELMKFTFVNPPVKLTPNCILVDFIDEMNKEHIEEKRELIIALAKDRKLSEIPKISQNWATGLKRHWGDNADMVVIKVECADDPFEDLDEILGDYANTRKEITGNEITGKQMVVHVEGIGLVGKFKEAKVDADNESEEESNTEGDYTSGGNSKDLDYDPKHDEVFDDNEHIVEDVHVSMNNFCFTADPKHDLSIGVVEVQKYDLDVIDYDSFGSDLDDGIDSERRIQLRELRRTGKHKNKGPNNLECEITNEDGADEEEFLNLRSAAKREFARRRCSIPPDDSKLCPQCFLNQPVKYPLALNAEGGTSKILHLSKVHSSFRPFSVMSRPYGYFFWGCVLVRIIATFHWDNPAAFVGMLHFLSTGKFNISCAVDGMARISYNLYPPAIYHSCWDGDLTT